MTSRLLGLQPSAESHADLAYIINDMLQVVEPLNVTLCFVVNREFESISRLES